MSKEKSPIRKQTTIIIQKDMIHYKRLILEIIQNRIEDEDAIFLAQIYTLLVRHIKKRENR